MPSPVICAACRTPVGRYAGALASVRPDDLAALVLAEVARRAGLDPVLVDDVIFGAANQSGEDNRNVARMATLLAGFPPSVSATTVNRLCASGLQAVQTAAHAVHAGAGDVFIAGGVESMSRAPLVTAKPERAFGRGDRTLYDTTLGWRFVNPLIERRYGAESMGETGENVAEQYGISRTDQDAWALKSQKAWAQADAEQRFARELVAVDVPGRPGHTQRVDRDEHPRPDTTLEGLAELKPAFRAGGSVTAGNAAGLNDGAAALVIADQARADGIGLPVRARIVATASAGVEPRIMGMGPVPATRKALDRAGLSVSDLDLIELNEAFASQVVACVRELGLAPDRVNVNGGAIAVGHPLGASGARLVVTLLHELERRQARYGLAAMCVGVGQGQAMIIERL